MVKNFIYISMVASFVLLSTGCGGGSSDNSKGSTEVTDTTAPTITTATPINVVEETNNTTTLTANEAATFSIDPTENFDLNGTKLTFSAPGFDQNGGNEYNVTVKATDNSNNVGEKVLTFNVTQTIAQAVVVPVGDKNLTVDGMDVVDPSGLKWLNEAPANIVDFNGAKSYCEGKGYRLASRDELLNLIDFTKGNHNNASLLEDELSAFSGFSESWASKIEDKFVSINFADGADLISDDATQTRSVICAKGTPAKAHTFVAENNITTDQATQLQWTSVGDPVDGNVRKAIDGDEAKNYCENLAINGGGWKLPTINELRTLMQTSDHKVPTSIAPEGTSVIWSSTEFTNVDANTQNYVLDLTKDIATIRSENIMTTNDDGNEVSQKLYITCVKRR